MMENSDKPKVKNMTIRVTEQLRKDIDALREAHFQDVQINSFLAYLVKIGLEEENIRFQEKKLREEARLKKASMVEDIPAYEERGTGTRGR
ncbi:MAG: hypothetical protein LBQ30_03060 [Treponema sp.]|jgi:hypothetical protein|nr:hypothetical protein [Treponema sp.]